MTTEQEYKLLGVKFVMIMVTEVVGREEVRFKPNQNSFGKSREGILLYFEKKSWQPIPGIFADHQVEGREKYILTI